MNKLNNKNVDFSLLIRTEINKILTIIDNQDINDYEKQFLFDFNHILNDYPLLYIFNFIKDRFLTVDKESFAFYQYIDLLFYFKKNKNYLNNRINHILYILFYDKFDSFNLEMFEYFLDDVIKDYLKKNITEEIFLNFLSKIKPIYIFRYFSELQYNSLLKLFFLNNNFEVLEEIFSNIKTREEFDYFEYFNQIKIDQQIFNKNNANNNKFLIYNFNDLVDINHNLTIKYINFKNDYVKYNLKYILENCEEKQSFEQIYNIINYFFSHYVPLFTKNKDIFTDFLFRYYPLMNKDNELIVLFFLNMDLPISLKTIRKNNLVISHITQITKAYITPYKRNEEFKDDLFNIQLISFFNNNSINKKQIKFLYYLAKNNEKNKEKLANFLFFNNIKLIKNLKKHLTLKT